MNRRPTPGWARVRARIRAFRLAAIVVLGVVSAMAAQQARAAGAEAFTATLENDVFTGSDNAYTNGLGLTWVSADVDTYSTKSHVRRWADAWRFLPFVGDPEYRTYASWSLAQEMHTPSDITLRDPPRGDQPYAGVLYVDNVLYARNERWSHAWELKLGMSGAASGAAVVQREFHHLIGAHKPRGWRTQVSNEPIFNVGLTSAHLWRHGTWGDHMAWRAIPVADAAIGNYYTGAGAGIYGEVGQHLVDAFGGTSLRGGLNAGSTVGVDPTPRVSWSLFGGVSGHVLSRYLPLDGTAFREGPSVESKRFVGSATAGVSLRRRNLALSFAITCSSPAFIGQTGGAEFGTVSVSWYPE